VLKKGTLLHPVSLCFSMPVQPTSLNFKFLREDNCLLDEYALRAELTVYDDPNTSLIKTRQVGELLAKSTAAYAGMDCTDNTFDETIALLKRQRVLPTEEFWLFDQVRLWGNEAAHNHTKEPRAALQSLIGTHKLANWFKTSILRDANFRPAPFRPPPKPKNASKELKEEIDFLRGEVARSRLVANASESQVKDLSERLEREAIAYQVQIRQQTANLEARDRDLARLERESKERLKEIVAAANSETFQRFVIRSRLSAQRLGHGSKNLPLMQLRITTGEYSTCHNAPLIVVQSMSGGLISKNCAICNFPLSLKQEDFVRLHVYVLCPECRKQAMPTKVGRNYGYKCECGWTCELAALVAHYRDNETID
jgi:hypothetical protein